MTITRRKHRPKPIIMVIVLLIMIVALIAFLDGPTQNNYAKKDQCYEDYPVDWYNDQKCAITLCQEINLSAIPSFNIRKNVVYCATPSYGVVEVSLSHAQTPECIAMNYQRFLVNACIGDTP